MDDSNCYYSGLPSPKSYINDQAMNKRCPNTQQILLCDCTKNRRQVKEDQKKLLTEIMEADAKNGLYYNKPFNIALVRDITDYWDLGEISFSRMVEMLNEIAIEWHEKQTVSKMETPETWEDIEEEYMKDEYPVFGGPFNNAMTPFEWLKKYYYEPKRK